VKLALVLFMVALLVVPLLLALRRLRRLPRPGERPSDGD